MICSTEKKRQPHNSLSPKWCHAISFRSRWCLRASSHRSFSRRCLRKRPYIALLFLFLKKKKKNFLLKIFQRFLLLPPFPGVVPLALCPQVLSQAPQHFRPPEAQATCDGCLFHASLSARSFSFIPSRSGGAADAEINVASVGNPELTNMCNVLPLNPGVMLHPMPEISSLF